LVFELTAALLLRAWYAVAILETAWDIESLGWQIVFGICAGLGLGGYVALQSYLGVVPAVLVSEGSRFWPSLRRVLFLTAGNRRRVAVLVLLPFALEIVLEVAVQLVFSFAYWRSDGAAILAVGAQLLVAGLFCSFTGVLLACTHRWLWGARDGVLPNEAAAAFE
jgi:hypothetical protein